MCRINVVANYGYFLEELSSTAARSLRVPRTMPTSYYFETVLESIIS